MNINYVADLAHLALLEDERRRLQPQMDEILKWVERIGAVAAEEVPPTGVAAFHPRSPRTDEPGPSLPVQQALAAAPDGAAGMFRVPAVIQH